MFESFPPWLVWFVVGVAIALAELAVPGFVLIFFGLGCLGAALLAAFFPDAYTAQTATFVLVTILSLLTLRKMAMRIFVGKSETAAPGEDDKDFVKTRVTIGHDLEPGQQTRVRYRGTTWDAVARDHIPAGSEAEIVGLDRIDKSRLRIRAVAPAAEKKIQIKM